MTDDQTTPFITDGQRTAFCEGNEITEISASPLGKLDDRQALKALVEAARQMATGQGSSSSPPLPINKQATNGESQSQAQSDKDGDKDGEEKKEGGGPVEPLPVQRSRLPMAIKVRMVELYAQFHSVSEVRDIIKHETGHEVDLRTVGMYNPQVKSATIGKKLRAHFEASRKLYVERSTDMAVAHQAHRLKLIGRIVEKATNSRDYAAALKGLELAAKEVGGFDRPTVIQHTGAVSHIHGTVEEARAELAMRLQQVVDAGHILPAPSPDAQGTGTVATGED